jgi:hypothetical protein
MGLSIIVARAQGPLTPPGSPAPGMKRLEQVEPRVDVQNAPAAAVDASNPKRERQHRVLAARLKLQRKRQRRDLREITS